MELVSCLILHKAFSSELMENVILLFFCYCLSRDIFHNPFLKLIHILAA